MDLTIFALAALLREPRSSAAGSAEIVVRRRTRIEHSSIDPAGRQALRGSERLRLAQLRSGPRSRVLFNSGASFARASLGNGRYLPWFVSPVICWACHRRATLMLSDNRLRPETSVAAASLTIVIW